MSRHSEREGGSRLDKRIIAKTVTTNGRRRIKVDVDLSRNLDPDSPALNDVSVQELVEEFRGIGSKRPYEVKKRRHWR